MKNITVFISSFLVRGQRWRLVALAALFFVAGCTVELYPPAQDVSNLPDGGKVDVLPDTIPRAFAFGPRMYWSQIVASDSAYSIAVTDANNKGRWLDSLRWVPSGPYVTVNGDTLATRSYARDNSGATGDNQILTYNGSGSLTIEDGNTVDMSDLLDNTDAQTIDTLTLQGDTMLQMSLSGDGAPVKELDLSALRSIVDSTRLTQDSILVYYQDGAEVGRDTIGVTDDNQVLTYNGSGSLAIEDGNTVDMSDLLDNTDDQTIDTFSLSGTTLSLSLESDGQAAQTVDLSALAVIDSTRLTQDSILVYYQDGVEIGRDTIAGVGGTGGGSADNLGNHIMTQNLQTNGNWISGDGGNEGISVDGLGKVGIGTLTPSYILDLNSTDAIRLPLGTTAQNPIGATGLLRYNSDSTAFTGYYNAQWNKLVDLPYLQDNFWNTDGTDIWNSNSGVVRIQKQMYVGTTDIPNNTIFGNDPSFNVNSNYIHLGSTFGTANGLIFTRYGSGGTSWPNTGATISYNTILNKMYYSIKGGSSHIFAVDGVESFVIGQDVSIGTTTPATYKPAGQVASAKNFVVYGSSVANSVGLVLKNATNDGIDIWTNPSFYPSSASHFDTYLGEPDDLHYTRWIDSDTEAADTIYQFDSNEISFFPNGDGKIGINTPSPNAQLHLPAGTATANTAPLKFTSGTNLTTPEAGAMEWDGTNLYITQTTGPTRKTIAYVDTDDGSASDTTDGSGDITVSHTLGSASITVTATATGTTFYHVQVHSKTSTTFKIRFYNSLGPAATSTAVTADWIAKLQ